MSFKKASVAAMIAVSMAATPVLAQSAVAPSGAEISDASDARGGFLVPAIAVVAIILGILAAVGGGDDRPHSP